MKIIVREETQHPWHLNADNFFVFFVHVADDCERRVRRCFIKSFKRGELSRLIFSNALRAGVAGDRLQQRCNQRDRQADFQ